MIFAHWDASEKKRLIYNSKHSADETYNAHRALDDVVAMEELFTKTPLVSLLSSLTYAKQKHLGCKKGKANQKQQLFDYTWD